MATTSLKNKKHPSPLRDGCMHPRYHPACKASLSFRYRLVNADTLFILSDIDALYDADPRRDPNARRIPRVREITPELRAACTGAGSGLGTGGMETKLRAAEIAREGGISTVIINGTPPDNLYLALEGADIGTICEGGMGDA